jgi:hypothetical protein
MVIYVFSQNGSPSLNFISLAVKVSHMIAHNLGIHHDFTKGRDCICPKDDGCLMNTFLKQVGGGPPIFSSCSQDDYLEALHMGQGVCLLTSPFHVKSWPFLLFWVIVTPGNVISYDSRKALFRQHVEMEWWIPTKTVIVVALSSALAKPHVVILSRVFLRTEPSVPVAPVVPRNAR